MAGPGMFGQQPQQRKFNIDPAMAAMYGFGAPSLPSTPDASGAPAPAPQPSPAPPAQPPAGSAPVQPPVAGATPPPQFQAKPFTTYDDWLKSPEGQTVQNANPEYNKPGFWSKLGMGLAYGAQEFGGSMRGQSGIGSAGVRDWTNRLNWEDEQNRTRPGRIMAAYKESLPPQREQFGQDVQTHGVQVQDYQIQREVQQRAAGVYDAARQQVAQGMHPAVVRRIAMQKASEMGIPISAAELDAAIGGQPSTPMFKVEGGAIQPLVWRGGQYGPTPGQNEPPEITQARTAAQQTLDQQLGDKFGPEVLAQLGKPPIGDPKAMAEYGKKAAAIKVQMATDPRVAAALARPVQVILPSGAPGYMNAGKAMDTGATAAGAGTEVNKYVEKARASSQAAQQADAIASEIEKTGKITGPQAMTLLSLHVATTFGGIPGVGIGEALIKAHHDARSLPEDLWASFNKVKNGGNISPEQAKEWIGLIHEKRDLTQQTAQAEAQRLGVPLNLNGPTPGAVAGAGTEPTATGPNGHKLVLRNGAWVDAQTGRP